METESTQILKAALFHFREGSRSSGTMLGPFYVFGDG